MARNSNHRPDRQFSGGNSEPIRYYCEPNTSIGAGFYVKIVEALEHAGDDSEIWASSQKVAVYTIGHKSYDTDSIASLFKQSIAGPWVGFAVGDHFTSSPEDVDSSLMHPIGDDNLGAVHIEASCSEASIMI
jgi:hypothetical protein